VCRLASKDVRPRTRYLKSRLEPVTSVTGRDGFASAQSGKKPPQNRGAPPPKAPDFSDCGHNSARFPPLSPTFCRPVFGRRNGGRAGWHGIGAGRTAGAREIGMGPPRDGPPHRPMTRMRRPGARGWRAGPETVPHVMDPRPWGVHIVFWLVG
jgi:hypothetical protein